MRPRQPRDGHQPTLTEHATSAPARASCNALPVEALGVCHAAHLPLFVPSAWDIRKLAALPVGGAALRAKMIKIKENDPVKVF